MTDNDIIKALECCKTPVGSGACNGCPLKNVRDNLHKEDTKSCTTIAIESALDLINRQKADLKIAENINHLQMEELQSQKAEIERLQKENKILSVNADTAFQDGLNEAQDLYAEQIKNEVRAEAITEFAERCARRFPSFVGVFRRIAKEMKEGATDTNVDCKEKGEKQ